MREDFYLEFENFVWGILRFANGNGGFLAECGGNRKSYGGRSGAKNDK